MRVLFCAMLSARKGITMSRFLCLSRETDAVLYRAESLGQARGFSAGCEIPSRIVCALDSMTSTEFLYRIVVLDDDTGQVVCSGPIVDLLEAADALCGLRLVLMPIESGVTL